MPIYKRGKAKACSYGSLKAQGKFSSSAKTLKGSFPRAGGKKKSSRKMSY